MLESRNSGHRSLRFMSKHFTQEVLTEMVKKNWPKEDYENFEAGPWTQMFDCLVVDKDPANVWPTTEAELLGFMMLDFSCFF